MLSLSELPSFFHNPLFLAALRNLFAERLSLHQGNLAKNLRIGLGVWSTIQDINATTKWRIRDPSHFPSIQKKKAKQAALFLAVQLDGRYFSELDSASRIAATLALLLNSLQLSWLAFTENAMTKNRTLIAIEIGTGCSISDETWQDTEEDLELEWEWMGTACPRSYSRVQDKEERGLAAGESGACRTESLIKSCLRFLSDFHYNAKKCHDSSRKLRNWNLPNTYLSFTSVYWSFFKKN